MAVFSGNGSSTSPSFTFSSDTDVGMYRESEDKLAFGTGGTGRLFVNNTGCGVGTSNIGAQLHVKGPGTAGGDIAYFDDSGSTITGRLSIATTSGASGGAIRLGAINRNFLELGGAALPVLTVNGTTPGVTIKKDVVAGTTLNSSGVHLSLIGGTAGSDHVATLHFNPLNSSGNGSPAAIACIASGNTNSDLAFYTNPTSAFSSAATNEIFRATTDKYLRMASGTGGVQFGGDTAVSSALDDYEEGTWIPGNLDPDLTVSVARYIKIGRLVHAWFITVDGNTVATYDLPNSVTGLPYVRRMVNPYSNYGLLAGTVSVINNVAYSGSQIVWNGIVTAKFNDSDGCLIRWKNDTTESSPSLQPQIVNAPAGGLYFDFHVVYEADV